MSTGVEVKLQGTVHKTVIRPPKVDEGGFVQSQEVEIVLRIPMGDGLRPKLADLSRLQNAQTTHITLQDAQLKFKAEGNAPDKKPPKAKTKKK